MITIPFLGLVPVIWRAMATRLGRLRTAASRLGTIDRDEALRDLHCYGGLALIGVGCWLIAPSWGLIVDGALLLSLSGAIGTIRRRL